MDFDRLRDEGGLFLNQMLSIDAISVYAAVGANIVKPPAERSLVSHMQWLRQLLDTLTMKAFGWVDTRDMIAGGFTKGKASREAMHALMNGQLVLNHAANLWSLSQSRDLRELLGASA